MASITSLPATRAGSKASNLWRGIARTTMSASATASAAHRGSAPGTSTSVIRAIFSGSPEAAIATWKPASTATRAITGPEWPAPRTAMRPTCICNNFTQSPQLETEARLPAAPAPSPVPSKRIRISRSPFRALEIIVGRYCESSSKYEKWSAVAVPEHRGADPCPVRLVGLQRLVHVVSPRAHARPIVCASCREHALCRRHARGCSHEHRRLVLFSRSAADVGPIAARCGADRKHCLLFVGFPVPGKYWLAGAWRRTCSDHPGPGGPVSDQSRRDLACQVLIRFSNQWCAYGSLLNGATSLYPA